ncbi:hypothetical protein H0H87_000971, partial [Tephrocybe sp. NHM501043]
NFFDLNHPDTYDSNAATPTASEPPPSSHPASVHVDNLSNDGYDTELLDAVPDSNGKAGDPHTEIGQEQINPVPLEALINSVIEVPGLLAGPVPIPTLPDPAPCTCTLPPP